MIGYTSLDKKSVRILIHELEKGKSYKKGQKMKRYCFALDLIDNPELINSYKEHHLNVWPDIEASIKDSGIQYLEIYLVENRLFMIIDALDNFSLEEKSKSDLGNSKVQEWERLMWNYQKALPKANPGEKWKQMDRIYRLHTNT